MADDRPAKIRRDDTPGNAPFQPWNRKTEPEPRWWAFVAMVVVVLGQWWVGRALGLPNEWVYPAAVAILLAASVGVYLPTRRNPRPEVRAFAIAASSVVVFANAVSLVAFVANVFGFEVPVFTGVLGGSTPLGATDLLVAGLVLWLVNTLNFALIYWEMDGGGPIERANGYRSYPDLLFMQQQQRGWGPQDWKPLFADYVYVSLTSATAFSPTDTMPLSRRVKFAMGAQSVLSIAILAVLVARAVNIAASQPVPTTPKAP